MLKFQRNYRAEFEIGTRREDGEFIPRETLTVSYPFTVNFEIKTGTYTAANRGTFQFINLSRTDQALLWIDPYNAGEKYIYMKFYAGYGQNMPLIFTGFIQQCTSGKEGGSTEFITEMIVYDGGAIFQYGYLNATFTQGTTLEDIIKVAVKDLPNVSVGYITPDIKPLQYNRTYIGQTMNLISQEYSGYNVFVLNGEVNILGDRDVIPGEIQVISDEAGLLGSPRRANGLVYLQTIFEPQVKAGQAISLISSSLPWLNRAYSIVEVNHQGIISANVCGKLITSLTLTIGTSNMRELTKTTESIYSAPASNGKWLKPVKGRISDPYGWRIHPIDKERKFHHGLDIAAENNASVIAPANGKIINAYWYNGYGKYIEIDHGKNDKGQTITSAYGHLNNYLVNKRQVVSAGEEIGKVGSTGKSTGPHLHFEIRVGGKTINPIEYIGNY